MFIMILQLYSSLNLAATPLYFPVKTEAPSLANPFKCSHCKFSFSITLHRQLNIASAFGDQPGECSKTSVVFRNIVMQLPMFAIKMLDKCHQLLYV